MSVFVGLRAGVFGAHRLTKGKGMKSRAVIRLLSTSAALVTLAGIAAPQTAHAAQSAAHAAQVAPSRQTARIQPSGSDASCPPATPAVATSPTVSAHRGDRFRWPAGQDGNPANVQVAGVNYANYPTGSSGHEVYVFEQSVPLNPAKTVEAVMLPSLGTVTGYNPALHIFAMAIG
jgi:hypothetical protein